ncbi:MAG TPA: protein kinase, partial [Acidobacteriota bacterium]|nr:protein kinase [Acidobacteriota bacterium]
YVEGETLRRKMGQIGMEEAVEIAHQILTGLQVAHQAGIIHRDIKPENLMIREDGIVKLLDFGLAKLTKVSDLAQENLTTMLKTTKGFISGTVPYMSPEQARGLEVDHRSDLFSVGTVFYEMLSGSRPFQGATPADTLLAIIGQDPAPLSPDIPQALQEILMKALSKDPDARHQSASDFLKDMKLLQKGDVKQLSNVSTKPVTKRWGFSLFRRQKQKSGTGAAPVFAKLTQITFAEAVEQYPDWSPDGNRIVFCREVSGLRKLFLKNIRTGEEIPLTSGDYDEIQPAWSPDGSRILVVRSQQTGVKLEHRDVFGIYDGADIWSIDLETRKQSNLLKNAYNPSFSPDGKQLAFDASWAGARRIWIATAEGLNAQQVTSDVSEEISHSRPRWSPGAKSIVFQNQERTKFSVRVVDLASRKLSSLTDGFFSDFNPVWSTSGEYIYFSSQRSGGLNIWRIPVSERGEPTDAPQQVTVGAGQDVEMSISRNGKLLAFSILKQNADIWRLPVDVKTGEPAGAPQPVIATTREDSRGAWSPDGE